MGRGVQLSDGTGSPLGKAVSQKWPKSAKTVTGSRADHGDVLGMVVSLPWLDGAGARQMPPLLTGALPSPRWFPAQFLPSRTAWQIFVSPRRSAGGVRPGVPGASLQPLAPVLARRRASRREPPGPSCAPGGFADLSAGRSAAVFARRVCALAAHGGERVEGDGDLGGMWSGFVFLPLERSPPPPRTSVLQITLIPVRIYGQRCFLCGVSAGHRLPRRGGGVGPERNVRLAPARSSGVFLWFAPGLCGFSYRTHLRAEGNLAFAQGGDLPLSPASQKSPFKWKC